MKTIPCSSEAIAAAWIISSPEAMERAPQLPNSPGWRELRGEDAWVYMRLTKAAARALAQQLLDAASSGEPEVVTGRPQGTLSRAVAEERFGFYLHPAGASLSIEVADIPPIESLLEKQWSDPGLLSPQPHGKGLFKR